MRCLGAVLRCMGWACALMLGCGDDGSDSGLFGDGHPPYDGGDSDGGSGDGETTSGSSGSSDAGDDGSDGGTTADGGGTTGDDGGTSGGDGGTTGDDGGTTTGAGTTTSSSSSGGQACSNPGDIVVNGTTGPANSNQNCPTTMYTAVVAGSPGPIADVEVLLTAEAATTSEVTLTLQSPAATSVVLFDKHGGPLTDDFVGTHLDDASTSPVATAPAPRTGCFYPDQPLSAFNGQGGDGTWYLVVQTCLYAVNVQSWELRLTF